MQVSQTSCKDCIFAKYEGKTQTGCELGRLELLEKNGAMLVPAYDEEKEFTVIQGRFCMYCRDKSWAELYKNKDLLKNIHEEIKVKYQVILLSQNRYEATIETINSIFEQTILPKHITIIRHDSDSTNSAKFANVLKKKTRKKKCGWKVQNIVNYDFSIRDCVDIVLDVERHPYYFVVEAGSKIPHDLFTQISYKINEESLHFAMIKDDNNYIMNREVHDYYHGNREGTLEEKIEEEKCQNMIIDLNQIYQK